MYQLVLSNKVMYEASEPFVYDESRKFWVAGNTNVSDEGKDMVPRYVRKRISRPELKLLFTTQERLAIKAARAYAGTNESQKTLALLLNDFFEIIEDPSLTYIDLELPTTLEAFDLLVSSGLITEERKNVILQGVIE